MKNLYIALSFVAFSFTMTAQTKDTKTADKLFNQYEYVDAAKEYLKLVENGKGTDYVYKQLADSYYNVFNTAEAAKWYAKATETTQDAETYYRYAQMLKANGKYEEANKQMQKFANAAPSDTRAKAFRENPNYVPKLLDKAKLYNVKPSDISSDKSDFSAVLYNNTVYFTSARNAARKTYGWSEEPFLDIYQADYNADGTITNPTLVTSLNSKYHDAAVTISADGNTAYFSSDSFREGKFEKDKANKLKLGRNSIFKATKNGDSWGNITMLPFNSNEFSTSNPSLSRDGKTLYFSSDRPGSVGGVDIWKVSINADGTYGEPQNLGNKVNTEGNESFPFIADDNKTLFFSSSGKQGLGGFDIYQIDLSNGSEASNIGKPVNTEKDDFAFSFNGDKNIGFISSNRSGNDDIFVITPVCAVDVMIVVTNAKTGEILPNASVSILDDQKNVIATEMSNAKGEVTYKVECDRPYVVQASKDGFEGNSFAVTKSNGPKFKVDAALQPIDVIVTETEVVLKPIYFEFNKSNITQEGAFELDKLVQVMKNNDKIVILAKSHTDNRGSDRYNLNLSDRRAKSTVQYIISKGIPASRISGKGMGELVPKVDCGKDCTEEQHAQNRRSEFLIVKK
ncbi:cell envelope biogenesis protein OmpA [Flavobacterium silvisoli]|uniref:Cell envelope biogenesis protein OmpA n=1 Tax=Flavobacterium silvisoli TaxID=2529433 RepID=A0A4Q9Z3N7_9FLAO|nr:OmpA family protein [Flavobacterium silvisoli]TBX71055.1 cell envelope biogenesis protein OmpA [Flavobacterium silvisoli]